MRKTILLILAAALPLACGPAPDDEPAEDDAPPPEAGPPVTRPMTEGLALWRADGFTLLVPEQADLLRRRPEAPETWAAVLAGPGFVSEVEGRRVPGPPAYRLDVATYARADTIALEAWVAARLAERGEEAEPGVTVPIAGEAALRTGAPPGEPGPTSYWLARDGKVVELRVADEPESPLGPLQRHVLALVLSTFRWSGESEEP